MAREMAVDKAASPQDDLFSAAVGKAAKQPLLARSRIYIVCISVVIFGLYEVLRFP